MVWWRSEGDEAAVGATADAYASAHGGSGCIVRAWASDPAGLAAAGFDPDGADGVLGLRPRAAIRRWRSSRGARATGRLDGPSDATSCLAAMSCTVRSPRQRLKRHPLHRHRRLVAIPVPRCHTRCLLRALEHTSAGWPKKRDHLTEGI